MDLQTLCFVRFFATRQPSHFSAVKGRSKSKWRSDAVRMKSERDGYNTIFKTAGQLPLTAGSSRIPQWESDAGSEGQTLRNEDNAFLPLSFGQISLLCEFCQKNKALCQAAEKTLKQHTWVSSPLQVRLSLTFNCGIRDHSRF